MIAFLYPDVGYGPDDATLVRSAITATDALTKKGLRPDVVAGYGLGAFAAWYAAGGAKAHTAAKGAELRSSAVQKAPRGGLMAYRGDTPPPLNLETVAWNSSEEVVVCGTLADLEANLEALGGTWVHRGVPWYSWHLDDFVAPLLKKLQKLPTTPFAHELVNARDAKPVENPNAMARILAEQIASPIQWDRTLRNLYYQRGVRKFVFIGTKAAAERLVVCNVPQAEVITAS